MCPRLKAVVEAAVTEASEHLSRMDEAKMSEAAKSKSLEEKRRKVNLAIDQIELQRKKERNWKLHRIMHFHHWTIFCGTITCYNILDYSEN